MELLLDTHTFIWYINGDKKLPVKVKKAITNIQNTCFISIASVWEIAIKHTLGKLELASDFNKIAGFMEENDIQILPIELEHIQQLLRLKYHHRDPFDRIIIAQSITEGLTIITKDEQFEPYKAVLFW